MAKPLAISIAYFSLNFGVNCLIGSGLLGIIDNGRKSRLLQENASNRSLHVV